MQGRAFDTRTSTGFCAAKGALRVLLTVAARRLCAARPSGSRCSNRHVIVTGAHGTLCCEQGPVGGGRGLDPAKILDPGPRPVVGAQTLRVHPLHTFGGGSRLQAACRGGGEAPRSRPAPAPAPGVCIPEKGRKSPLRHSQPAYLLRLRVDVAQWPKHAAAAVLNDGRRSDSEPEFGGPGLVDADLLRHEAEAAVLHICDWG